jgi:Ca2+/H+ antiporter
MARPKSRFDPFLLLLLFVPIALVAEAYHAPATWVFATAAAAIVPLAALMGRATEHLAGAWDRGSAASSTRRSATRPS